jgi:hypothetical protein
MRQFLDDLVLSNAPDGRNARAYVAAEIHESYLPGSRPATVCSAARS